MTRSARKSPIWSRLAVRESLQSQITAFVVQSIPHASWRTWTLLDV